MLWTKRVITRLITLTLTRRVAAMGLIGCLFMAFVPLGCSNSISMAPLRYRAQNQNAAHLLRDVTVERLQECVETYGKELRQLEPSFAHAKAHVQVTPEGQVVDVQVTGIPDSAPDLAGCTRIALREMTVPASVLSLRQKDASDSTTEQTAPRGNEMANPIVLWEAGVLLAEFIAQHGGRAVLYTVTIEVLSAAAIAATAVSLEKERARCRRVKEACIISCGDSRLPTGTLDGVPFHKCVRECMERAGCFYNPP